MDNQAQLKIKDLLSRHTVVGIMLSKNPTVDHAGAGLALYLALRQMNKQVSIASPTPATVEISNLVGIDKVKNTLGGDGGDLTVSFPYKEGEIEKVSYTLESGYLNIVVKSGDKGLHFQEKEVLFKKGGGKVPPLMFFVGVPRLTDLGNLFNPDAYKDTTIVNIDNRPDNQGFGDVIMVSPKFSSVSEQIGQLLTQLDGSVDIDQDIAQNLLSGIAQATNDFQDPKTSYLAFEMAGVMMRKGAARQRPAQEQRQEPNASFFPYQPQQGQAPTPSSPDKFGVQSGQTPIQSGQMPPRPQNMPRPQQFPRPFPRPFPGQQNQPFGQQRQQPQPMQPNQQQSQQMQQPQQNQQQSGQNGPSGQQDNRQQQRQAPPDWLTPKVYKGSTVL